MEKICIIEAGNYLLGIDTDAIISMQDADSYIKGEVKDKTIPTLLSSCLDQNMAPLPRSKYSQSKYSIMELRTQSEPLTLAINRIVAEIKVPDHFPSLPLLYPKLARQCFPQIFIHDDQPVLLLDGDALDTIFAELKDACHLLHLKPARQKSANKNTPTADLPVAACSTTKVPDATPESAPAPPAPNAASEPAPALTPTPKPKPEPEPAPPTAKLDDAAFKSIVSWVIAEFLKRGSNKKCAIGINELPAGYLHPSLLQGTNGELLQRLVNKTLHKCATVQSKKLQQLTKKTAGNKS